MLRANKNVGRAQITEKRRWQWNAHEKLAIIIYLEKHPSHSIRTTAIAFNIELKQVRDWHNKKEELMCVSPHIQQINKEKPPKYPELEKDIYNWIKELC